MLTAAFKIYQNMLQNEIFSTTEQICYFAKPEYKIIITGHSLGAGTAAILGFFLRLEEGFKDRVYVYAYGIPGGLLNPSAREESKKFVVGIIHNDDVVPRLSLQSIFELNNKMRITLYNCEEPKYSVICWGIGNAFLSCLLCCCKSISPKVLQLNITHSIYIYIYIYIYTYILRILSNYTFPTM